MTGLVADSNGVVTGKFNIPAGVLAGNKEVVFTGAGGGEGVAIFSGQGTVERQTWQQQTTVTETRWQSPPPPEPPPRRTRIDPLAQTFVLTSAVHCSGIDLWFSVKPTTLTMVQLRETTVGFPNQRVIAEARLDPDDINIGGAHTRALFDLPVTLLSGNEYAIVVLCNDAIGALSIAELGKFDATAQRWITSQPYTVGVMLSSSNASTWTVHQDRDLAFRVLRANYSETSKTIDLGVVSVTAATDLILMSYADRPASNTGVEYTLTLPDLSTVTVSDGQPVQLAAAITGDVGVTAHLVGGNSFSPVLWPGSQLVAGAVSLSDDYVTRAVPAGTGSTVKAIYEANIPGGANVEAYYKGIDGGDTWASLPVASTRNVDDGFVEFICSAASVDEDAVQIKLILTGTAAARPRVRDLRVIVV